MRKNKYIILLVAVCAMLMLIGCGTSMNKKVISAKKMQSDELVLSYFAQYNVNITSFELIKRQTNEDDKEDYAYINVKAENDVAMLDSMYIVKSIYYDEGGWQVESVYPETVAQFTPKGEPLVSDVVNSIPIMNELYNSVKAMELENGVVEIKETTQISQFEYSIKYSLKEKGKIAQITAIYEADFKFNTEIGVWEEYKTKHLEDEMQVMVVASSGEWVSDDGKVSVQLKFRGDKLYIYSYENKEDSMTLYNEAKNGVPIEYYADSGLTYSFGMLEYGFNAYNAGIRVYPNRLVFDHPDKQYNLVGIWEK